MAEDPNAMSNKYMDFMFTIRTDPDRDSWSEEEPDNYASYRFKVKGKDTNIDDYFGEFEKLVDRV